MEGEAIAKSTTASLRFSSISFMTHAVRAISPGVYTTTCLIAFVARSNAGSKSTRDTCVTRVGFKRSAIPSACDPWIQYV
eukprot:5875794-Pleurochrysis_carterae.AAC.1